MKKLMIITAIVGLIACNGNESADSRPTDLDRTDNDDTAAINNTIQDSTFQNNTDSTHQ